jgi:hypothetical protein
MPHFFPAHLVALVGILLAMFVAYPFALAQLSGVKPIGLLALGLAIGAPTLWGVQFNRFSYMFVSMIVFYSLMTNWGMKFWVTEATNHGELFGLLVVAGTLAVGAWLWRLCNMSEEGDDYLNMYQALLARRTGSEAVEQRRVVAAQIGRSRFGVRLGDWWHGRLGGYYGGSRWGLVRVLRYGFSAYPMEVQGLFMVAMFVCMGIFFKNLSFMNSSGPANGIFIFFGQFSILMPGQMAGELLAQRRPRMVFEMLLPVSRESLVGGLIAAAARNAAVFWLMMNVSIGIVLAMTGAEYSLTIVAMFVLLSATTTFALTALSLRTAVWPSRAKRMAVMIPSWLILLLPLILWMSTRKIVGDAIFHVGAAILIGVGAWMLYSAKRVWLTLEFA